MKISSNCGCTIYYLYILHVLFHNCFFRILLLSFNHIFLVKIFQTVFLESLNYWRNLIRQTLKKSFFRKWHSRFRNDLTDFFSRQNFWSLAEPHHYWPNWRTTTRNSQTPMRFVCFVLFAIIQSTFRLFKGQQY